MNLKNPITLIMILMVMLGSLAAAAAEPAADPAAISQSNALTDQAQSSDIYDIKPIEKIGFNPDYIRYTVYAALAIAGLALISAVLIFWNKWRRKPVQDVVAHLCPKEEAFQLLDQAADLMNTDGRQFYFQLSMILRGYIDKRFDIDAVEMTTEELIPCIVQLRLDTDLQRGVKEFFNASDPVQFAGFTPDRLLMAAHLEFVKNFVKATAPADLEDSGQPLTLNP